MKILTESELKDFLSKVDMTSGDVFLRSAYGDQYNLKSLLSAYVAIGKLIEDHGLDLELFCANKEDEHLFFEYFEKHPESL